MPRKPSNFDNSKIPCLFELMNKQGLTAKELSVKTGISETSISDWRKGISAPTIDYLIVLADTLNISIDCLVGRTEQKQIDTNQSSTTNPREKILIYLLNQLSENDKDIVIGMVQTFVNTRTAQADKSFKEEKA